MRQSSVGNMLHRAHLRYQRQMLKPSSDRKSIPTEEIKGCRVVCTGRQRVFETSWFTGLRSNFWKAYFETLSKM